MYKRQVLNSGDANAYTKKERLTLQRERDKLNHMRQLTRASLTAVPDFAFDSTRSAQALRAHFGVKTLAGFGV